MTSPADDISSAAAAAMCGVDRATFNRWAARGLVPILYTTPSGERVYSRAAMEQFVAQRPKKISVVA